MKTLIFLIAAILVMTIGYFLLIYKPKEMYHLPSLPSERDICQLLGEDAKTFCEDCKKISAPGDINAIVHCTAIAFVNVDNVEAAKRVCTYFKEDDEQKLCRALAFVHKDLNASIAECDLIETDRKPFCRALVLREVDVDRALTECEKIDPRNEQFRNDCRRFVLEKQK